MGRGPLGKVGGLCAAWLGEEVDDWESLRKERGRLGRDMSICSLDGGEMGHLERLGLHECTALVEALGVGV